MFYGPLAQLVECSHGMREVSGSIPLRSTRKLDVRLSLPKALDVLFFYNIFNDTGNHIIPVAGGIF